MNAERDAANRRRGLRCAIAALLVLAGCGDDPVDLDPSCREAEPLRFGVTLLADLRSTDPVFDGSAIDYYSILPPESGTLVIEMAAADPDAQGDAVDPFLYLWDEDLGDPIDQAYDPAGDAPLPVARLEYAVQPGCYRVGASAWPAADTGPYTLRAELVSP